MSEGDDCVECLPFFGGRQPIDIAGATVVITIAQADRIVRDAGYKGMYQLIQLTYRALLATQLRYVFWVDKVNINDTMSGPIAVGVQDGQLYPKYYVR